MLLLSFGNAASAIGAFGGACTSSAGRGEKVLARGRDLLGLVGHCLLSLLSLLYYLLFFSKL